MTRSTGPRAMALAAQTFHSGVRAEAVEVAVLLQPPPVRPETTLPSQRGCWVNVALPWAPDSGVMQSCGRAVSDARIDLGICDGHVQELSGGEPFVPEPRKVVPLPWSEGYPLYPAA